MNRRIMGTFAVLTATATLLGACGSKKSGSTTTTTAAPETTVPTTAPTTTAPLTPQEAAALAKLQPLMVQQNDVGAGWNPQPAPSTPTATVSGIEAQFYGCLGIRDISKDVVARANSQLFSNPQTASTVLSQGEAYSNGDDVPTLQRGLAGGKASGCLTAAVKGLISQAQQGVNVGATNLTVTSGPVPGRSNQMAAIDGTVQITFGQNQVSLNITSVYLRAGNNETVILTMYGLGSPVPADVRTRVEAGVAGRAAKA